MDRVAGAVAIGHRAGGGRAGLWQAFGGVLERLGELARLEWLFRFSWWGFNRASDAWGSALSAIEGAGYFGWVMVFILLGYLLVR